MIRTAQEIGSYNVSTFRECDRRNVADKRPLIRFLRNVCGDPRMAQCITMLRSLPYKSDAYNFVKRHQIPACTPSCVCEDYRGRDYVVERNPLICLDIDKADNEAIMDTPEKRLALRNALFQWSCTYAAGTSCSGLGIYIIVALESNTDDEEFLHYFLALQAEFAKYGIVIDKACKDVTRLRIGSSDEVLIKEGTVECWSEKKEPEQPQIKPYQPRESFMGGVISKEKLLIEVVNMLIEHGYRTDDYASWLNCAFALYPLGQDGLELLNTISSRSDGYEGYGSVARKFTNDVSNSRYSIDDSCRYFFGKAKMMIGPGYAYNAQERILKRINNTAR